MARRLDLDRLLPRSGSIVRTGLTAPLGREFPDDLELQLVVDTLVSRGYDKETVVSKINGYQGDLWAEVFGPAMDMVAEKLGFEPYPPEEI